MRSHPFFSHPVLILQLSPRPEPRCRRKASGEMDTVHRKGETKPGGLGDETPRTDSVTVVSIWEPTEQEWSYPIVSCRLLWSLSDSEGEIFTSQRHQTIAKPDWAWGMKVLFWRCRARLIGLHSSVLPARPIPLFGHIVRFGSR